jgi:TPP-dependent pyruvate/acetoin dehydrogenase alpha subunit
MLTIRGVEQKLLKLYGEGKLQGTVHTCIGQEACAVGVVNALNQQQDVIFSNHRSHGHFLAFTGNIFGLLCEAMGKPQGVCGGIGGSQHLYAKNYYTNGIQGSILPVATGIALAEKKKCSKAVVCCFIGDGTLGEGAVYESLNIASLWSLPLLVVLENNQYAQSTPSRMQIAGSILKRAEAFDIRALELEASDVADVYATAEGAVAYIRETGKPCFIHLQTYRYSPHSKGDDFRDQEEIETYKKRDPLMRLQKQLKKYAENIENESAAKIELALKQAESAPSFASASR